MLWMSQAHSSEFLFSLAGSGRCRCRCCSHMPSGTNNAAGFTTRIEQNLLAGGIVSHAAIVWVVKLLPDIIMSRLLHYQTNVLLWIMDPQYRKITSKVINLTAWECPFKQITDGINIRETVATVCRAILIPFPLLPPKTPHSSLSPPHPLHIEWKYNAFASQGGTRTRKARF